MSLASAILIYEFVHLWGWRFLPWVEFGSFCAI